MLQINDVYQHLENFYRVLKLLSEDIVWIDIQDEKAFPCLVSSIEVLNAIESFETHLVDDPFKDLALIQPLPGSTNQIKRDGNYQLIKKLVENDQFYIPSIRSSIIKEIMEQEQTTKQTIYRLVRQYWQRGQTPNALIPQYQNSGAKGIKRVAKETKLGRKREHSEGVGALITEDVERLFHLAINKYLLTDKKHTMKYAHREFQILFRSLYSRVPESEIPTLRQFQYFYHREYSPVTRLQARSNKIEYAKDIRALHSTVNTQVLGPGSRYEIDATIADIYLVSNRDREAIIGRPVIYFVIDVFSRMIAGFYIGLENPSYVTSMQALNMAFTDKVAYCKKFGIDISSEQWPSIGLPDAILADRGELLGHQIENLEKSFSIRIENAPPFRGDLKPIVESRFKLIQANFKPFAEGVVEGVKERKRGGNDYRLDAILNMQEFTKIILLSVLKYNQYHQITTYDRDIDMPPDLPLVPIHLWNWGIQNCTGKLRSASGKEIYIALLPRKNATISDKGLKLFGVFFTCPELYERGWLHRKSTVSRPKSIQVAYDPSNAEQIYVFYADHSMKYWVAELSPHSREFIGSSFWSVWQIKGIQSKTKYKQELKSNLAQSDVEQNILAVIKQARSEKAESELSNSEKLAAIRQNKDKAKHEERSQRTEQAMASSSKSKVDQIKVEGNVISMPKRRKTTEELEEELKLRFPSYHSLLTEDDEDD